MEPKLNANRPVGATHASPEGLEAPRLDLRPISNHEAIMVRGDRMEVITTPPTKEVKK
jgi:hypothetical protein